jgi:hypothetical protein
MSNDAKVFGEGCFYMHLSLTRWDGDFAVVVVRVTHCDVDMTIWLVF